MKFNPKTQAVINKYINISNNVCISYAIYDRGKIYIYESNKENKYFNIGSISKTLNALLVLKLKQIGLLRLDDNINKFIELKPGNYPTIYECLTHLTRYRFLTPIEFTIRNLLTNGYHKRNLYQKVTRESLVKAIERRRKFKTKNKTYCYSDVDSALLSLVIEKKNSKENN